MILTTTAPELADDVDDASRTEAIEGRIAGFREDTREQRMAIAREAEHRFDRKVAWGVRIGDRTVLYTHLAVPVMTRLRQPERLVLDTLVGAGVAGRAPMRWHGACDSSTSTARRGSPTCAARSPTSSESAPTVLTNRPRERGAASPAGSGDVPFGHRPVLVRPATGGPAQDYRRRDGSRAVADPRGHEDAARAGAGARSVYHDPRSATHGGERGAVQLLSAAGPQRLAEDTLTSRASRRSRPPPTPKARGAGGGRPGEQAHDPLRLDG